MITTRQHRTASAVIALALGLFAILRPAPLCAEDAPERFPELLGVGVLYGATGMIDYDTPPERNQEWIGDRMWGGGLVFEKMFNRYFGLHSGMWYTKLQFKIRSEKDQGTEEIHIENVALTMPVFAMASIGIGPVTVSLLAGVCFTYITESYISVEHEDRRYSTNAMRVTNYTQEGVGGGLEIKYTITDSFDIFIAGTAERYLSDYLTNIKDLDGKMYNYSVKIGVLHRAF